MCRSSNVRELIRKCGLAGLVLGSTLGTRYLHFTRWLLQLLSPLECTVTQLCRTILCSSKYLLQI